MPTKSNQEAYQIQIDGVLGLYNLLSRVPFLRVDQPDFNQPVAGPYGADGYLRVQHGNTTHWILIEVKRNAQMRDARAAINQLKSLQQTASGGISKYPVFVAPYLGESIRQLCIDENIGYFDFSGNCRLVFNDVFIEKEVPGTEFREKKRLKSLFSRKASHIMRRLLQQPRKLWTMEELAHDAGVSIATAYLLKNKLVAEEFGVMDGESLKLIQAERLLREWAKQYTSRNYNQEEYYGEGDVSDLERQLAEYC